MTKKKSVKKRVKKNKPFISKKEYIALAVLALIVLYLFYK